MPSLRNGHSMITAQYPDIMGGSSVPLSLLPPICLHHGLSLISVLHWVGNIVPFSVTKEYRLREEIRERFIDHVLLEDSANIVTQYRRKVLSGLMNDEWSYWLVSCCLKISSLYSLHCLKFHAYDIIGVETWHDIRWWHDFKCESISVRLKLVSWGCILNSTYEQTKLSSTNDHGWILVIWWYHINPSWLPQRLTRLVAPQWRLSEGVWQGGHVMPAHYNALPEWANWRRVTLLRLEIESN